MRALRIPFRSAVRFQRFGEASVRDMRFCGGHVLDMEHPQQPTVSFSAIGRGGGLRSAIFRRFPPFPAIFRVCFLHVHLACVLVCRSIDP